MLFADVFKPSTQFIDLREQIAQRRFWQRLDNNAIPSMFLNHSL